ncbi:MAG: biopolymer transport protein ExbD [Halieaceae bacterium]|jgi:biopolymer transport protein ExbD
MRKFTKEQVDEGADIDLTPMLDVVFIMLIFFIVVASFIKEAGIEINRPDKSKSDPSDASSILVIIEADDQIWMENRRVDARAVRANIQRLLATDPLQPLTIKVEKGAKANSVVEVADAAREAGVGAVNWASAGK